jgi:hypothetical protein
MEKNVSGIGQVMRIVVGLGLLSLFLLDGPLVETGRTGFLAGRVGWCPRHLPFGIKTCKSA